MQKIEEILSKYEKSEMNHHSKGYNSTFIPISKINNFNCLEFSNKKIIKPYKNIQIDNYFTYFERGLSPLRLEIIPAFKPKSNNYFNEVIENTIQLIYQIDYIHKFHKNRYKLPYCILNPDITSRNVARYANKLINEKLNQIKRNLPIPMIIKRGFE